MWLIIHYTKNKNQVYDVNSIFKIHLQYLSWTLIVHWSQSEKSYLIVSEGLFSQGKQRKSQFALQVISLLSWRHLACDFSLLLALSWSSCLEQHLSMSSEGALCVVFKWFWQEQTRLVSVFRNTFPSTRFCSARLWNSGSLQLSAEQLWGTKSFDLSLKHFGYT